MPLVLPTILLKDQSLLLALCPLLYWGNIPAELPGGSRRRTGLTSPRCTAISACCRRETLYSGGHALAPSPGQFRFPAPGYPSRPCIPRASTANSARSPKTGPALPTMIPCAGCSIWLPSESSSTGMPGARTGTWSSPSSRSCLPTGQLADPLASASTLLCSSAPSLVLSNIAYTEFCTMPTKKFVDFSAFNP